MPPLTLTSRAAYLLSGLFIYNRRERLDFKPFAFATLFIFIYILVIFSVSSVMGLRRITLSQRIWNANSDLCVFFESIRNFHVTGILKKNFFLIFRHSFGTKFQNGLPEIITPSVSPQNEYFGVV